MLCQEPHSWSLPPKIDIFARDMVSQTGILAPYDDIVTGYIGTLDFESGVGWLLVGCKEAMPCECDSGHEPGIGEARRQRFTALSSTP